MLGTVDHTPDPGAPRSTVVAPYWEKEQFVGIGKEFRLVDVSVDDIVLGVKAVDREGNESPVSVYRIVPRKLP